MTLYKNFKVDTDFARPDIGIVECFADEDVSVGL
jgi:hypothetical protein